MPRNKQRSSRRSWTRHIYLDPHYFAGFLQKRAHGERSTYKSEVFSQDYGITTDDVYADLTYGRD